MFSTLSSSSPMLTILVYENFSHMEVSIKMQLLWWIWYENENSSIIVKQKVKTLTLEF